MKKLILTALIVLLAANLATANTESVSDNNKVPGAVWVEGGSPIGKPGASVAVGIRFGYAGIKFGYGGAYDYRSSKVYDAVPIDSPSILGMSSAAVGKKTIDPSWGFDAMGFYDVIKNEVAIYGEVGGYLQEVRNVRVVTGMTQPVQNWGPGQLYNIEKKKQELSLAGGGGVQWRFLHGPVMDLMLTAGYHTVRGVSGGLGLSW